MTPEAAGPYHKIDGSANPRGLFWIPFLPLSKCSEHGSIPTGHAEYSNTLFAVVDTDVVEWNASPAWRREGDKDM